jgi:hypothetical protein
LQEILGKNLSNKKDQSNPIGYFGPETISLAVPENRERTDGMAGGCWLERSAELYWLKNRAF